MLNEGQLREQCCYWADRWVNLNYERVRIIRELQLWIIRHTADMYRSYAPASTLWYPQILEIFHYHVRDEDSIRAITHAMSNI